MSIVRLEQVLDRRTFLKIKGLSLAQEARIIKRMQKKRPAHAEEMHNHRVNVVRPAARNAHLAYGFLRGRTKRDMEFSCRTKPNLKAVQLLVRRHGLYWPWPSGDDPDGYAAFRRKRDQQDEKLVAFLKEWE